MHNSKEKKTVFQFQGDGTALTLATSHTANGRQRKDDKEGPNPRMVAVPKAFALRSVEQGAGHDQTPAATNPFNTQCCRTANETSNLKVCEEVYRKMELSLFRCKLFQNLFETPFYLDFLI